MCVPFRASVRQRRSTV